MKKFIAFVLMIFTMGVTAQMANAHGEKSSFKGTWEFKCDQAPYGYNDGKIVVAEKSEKVSVKVTFSDGTILTGQNVKVKDGELTFDVSVDYDTVEVSLKRKGNKLTGSADTPEGKMDVQATKK
ncbi:hypothetical protein EMN47_06240 [Prolixibacteraceae bacterium JC049]|nr:hypothetical protein [Prolixibacteraceae bacterium JC049]